MRFHFLVFLVVYFFVGNAFAQLQAETTPALCADGYDNDGDRLGDCADPDCQYLPQCAGAVAAPAVAPTLQYPRSTRGGEIAGVVHDTIGYVNLVVGGAMMGVEFYLVYPATMVLMIGSTFSAIGSLMWSASLSARQNYMRRNGMWVRPGPQVAAWILTSLTWAMSAAAWVTGMVISWIPGACFSLGALLTGGLNTWIVRRRWSAAIAAARPYAAANYDGWNVGGELVQRF